MENRRITIENLTGGVVNIYEPSLRLDRVWERKGAKKKIDLDVLKEAIYSPGVEYFFKNGILGIDEKDALDIMIELGLEEPDVKEPENVIVLTDMQRKRLMTTAPIDELKETVEKLGYEQIQSLADYAIENKLSDFTRCKVIKDSIGTDIIKAIELEELSKED